MNIVDASGLTGLGRGICSSEYRLIDFETGEVQFQPTWERISTAAGFCGPKAEKYFQRILKRKALAQERCSTISTI